MANTPLNRLDSRSPNFEAGFQALVDVIDSQDQKIAEVVAAIVKQVRQEGDAAVLRYTERFDGVVASSIHDLTVSRETLAQTLASLSSGDRDALEAAADRIRQFHLRQKMESWSYHDQDGTLLGQRVTPLDRVGLYVPGGKAAYPSSVLMNAIPAKVAGVPEITMVVPTPRGERNAWVLAAAAVAGVDRVLTIGGAQAVAALAFGTASIESVDKIVGPGNAYVAEAKRQVFGKVGIDMIAGPSEILVIADGSVDPDWVAIDLFSQAEHDEMAQAILLSPSAAYLDAVHASIDRLLPLQPRAAVIAASLARRGLMIQTSSLEDAARLSNRIAPEHLELLVEDPDALLPHLKHAGAIFCGAYTSESLGDYCAGPNHVLPTSRSARFSSPLGVYDFQKRTSLIKVSKLGAARLGPIAARLADGEGLAAHAMAARIRFESASKPDRERP